MTELVLFYKCIPMIAEITTRCRDMSAPEYMKWKAEVLEAAPAVSKSFVAKVLTVIDTELKKMDKGS